jgi:hypothetical protein
MGASICCEEAEANTQFTIFDLPELKKQCLIFLSFFITHAPGHMFVSDLKDEDLTIL